MPELAEVEYYRKQWMPAVGERIRSVVINPASLVFEGTDTALLARGLVGESLQRGLRHGKQMCFVFSNGHWLGIHLGMTGKIALCDSALPQGEHNHLIMTTESGRKLVFTDPRMFGRVLYAQDREAPYWFVDLPPEPLDPAFTLDRMNSYLNRRSKASIKGVLLMQEFFPGIGNWMADEILWRSRIQPSARAGAIGAMKRIELFNVTRAVCEDALRVIGTDWGRPPDDWLFNHRWKDGGQCPKMGGRLRRETIGGRTTCWSPLWQVYRGELKRSAVAKRR